MLLLAVVASLVLMNVPYGYFALYPFKLFATWIHESFHALTALILGGNVVSIEIATDTSGLTMWGPPGGIRHFFVSTMGYMGTSLFGALMLILRNRRRAEQAILLTIALFMAISLVLYVRNAFGFVVVASIGAAFVLIALKLSNDYARLVLNVIAAQCCINALLDIQVLFNVTGRSDAVAAQEQTGIPYWFWASLWLVASGAIFYLAWKRSRRAASANATN